MSVALSRCGRTAVEKNSAKAGDDGSTSACVATSSLNDSFNQYLHGLETGQRERDNEVENKSLALCCGSPRGLSSALEVLKRPRIFDEGCEMGRKRT